MNKKLLSILIILMTPLIAIAENSPFPSTMRGIKIVPMANQELPGDLKIELKDKRAEEKIKGYQTTNDNNAGFLLNIKHHASQEIQEAKSNNYGIYDTHLKKSSSEIKLSFPFKGISGIESKDVIGYAAIGTYVKEKDGWNGIKEIFTYPSVGNCAYSYMGILAVQLAEETTEYLVNRKPSNKVIKGNINSGFLYTLTWYTNNSMSTLECANISFNPEIMTKIIALANQVDKNQS